MRMQIRQRFREVRIDGLQTTADYLMDASFDSFDSSLSIRSRSFCTSSWRKDFSGYGLKMCLRILHWFRSLEAKVHALRLADWHRQMHYF